MDNPDTPAKMDEDKQYIKLKIRSTRSPPYIQWRENRSGRNN